MFQRPDCVEIGTTARQRRHCPAGNFQSHTLKAAAIGLKFLRPEELAAGAADIESFDFAQGGFVTARPDGTAHSNKVGLLLGQLQQRLPGWVVIDIEIVRVGRVDGKSAEFVEIDRGPVHRFAA